MKILKNLTLLVTFLFLLSNCQQFMIQNWGKNMTSSNRPLSPHLQVYRPQLTSILSITHRATGIALSFGIILLIAWILATAAGENYFNTMNSIITSWFGKLVLVGFTWALFYHLCNGVRHLFWDAGYGFELSTVYKSGYATVGASVLLTSAAWIIGISIWLEVKIYGR